MTISKFKNNWTRTIACVIALALTSGGYTAEQSLEWVERWNSFAQQTGEAKHAEWAATIGDPEAVELAREWEEISGLYCQQFNQGSERAYRTAWRACFDARKYR